MERAKLQRGNLVRDMRKLLESHIISDVTLCVGSRRFPAHRAVLAARSPVFAAMLQCGTQEADSGCIDIPDVEEEVLEDLLCYMYTDRTVRMGKLTEKLLIAADKYDLPLLKRKCEERMIRKIQVNNAAALAVFALTYSCKVLKSYVIGYIRAHKDEVVASDGWAEAQKSSSQIIAEVCDMLVAAEPGKRTASEMADQEDLELSLEYEAQYGTLEEVQSLVEAGANLEARSRKDWRRTALHVAAAEGREEIVVYLLREGAEVDSKDEYGMTALLIAAGSGYLGTVRALLQAGADCDARDKDGVTPLQCAAAEGHVDVVRALLADSADVNARDKHWYTPLHSAACFDHPEVATVLLAAGADSGAKNRKGKTPLDVVKRKNKHKWEQILRENH